MSVNVPSIQGGGRVTEFVGQDNALFDMCPPHCYYYGFINVAFFLCVNQNGSDGGDYSVYWCTTSVSYLKMAHHLSVFMEFELNLGYTITSFHDSHVKSLNFCY